MRKERAMVAVAALLASFSIASAQKPPIPNESLSAPTATQSTRPDRPNFEDRWSGQPAIQYLPPAAISNVTTLETTGYAPTVSKKMGPEMESAGDVRGAPDSE